jgi:hypothetical protein
MTGKSCCSSCCPYDSCRSEVAGGLARRNHLGPRTVYPPERRGLLQVDAPKKGQAGRGPFLGVSGVVGSAAAAIHSLLGFFSRERNSAFYQITTRVVKPSGADCRCFRQDGKGGFSRDPLQMVSERIGNC